MLGALPSLTGNGSDDPRPSPWLKGKRRIVAGGILLLSALAFFGIYSVLKPGVGDLIAATMHHDELKIDRLIRRGVDVNGKEKWGWHRENEGRTPLTTAVRSGSVTSINRLIRAGADVNLPDGFAETPACAAAWGGDPEIIRLLAEAGADFRVIHEKKSLVELATESGHLQAAEEIRKVLAEKARQIPE